MIELININILLVFIEKCNYILLGCLATFNVVNHRGVAIHSADYSRRQRLIYVA